MVTDPIADMLNRIKNAGVVRHETVTVPHSKFVLAIADTLKRHGYVVSITKKNKKSAKVLEIGLAYDERKNPKVKGVERLSKPSCRLYSNAKSLKPVRNGYGMLVLSTPKGVLSGDEARKESVGGEMLFKIW